MGAAPKNGNVYIEFHFNKENDSGMKLLLQLVLYHEANSLSYQLAQEGTKAEVIIKKNITRFLTLQFSSYRGIWHGSHFNCWVYYPGIIPFLRSYKPTKSKI